MNKAAWLLVGLLILVTWVFKKLWIVLVVFLIIVMFSFINNQATQDEPKDPNQPSAVMQWFIDNTPKK